MHPKKPDYSEDKLRRQLIIPMLHHPPRRKCTQPRSLPRSTISGTPLRNMRDRSSSDVPTEGHDLRPIQPTEGVFCADPEKIQPGCSQTDNVEVLTQLTHSTSDKSTTFTASLRSAKNRGLPVHVITRYQQFVPCYPVHAS